MKTKPPVRKVLIPVILGVVFSTYLIWAINKPPLWEAISSGMTAGEIQDLVGSPSTDSLDLKGLQTWESTRIFFKWRLRAIYGSDGARLIQIRPEAGWLP